VPAHLDLWIGWSFGKNANILWKISELLFYFSLLIVVILGVYYGKSIWLGISISYFIVQVCLIFVKIWDLNVGVSGGWQGYLNIIDAIRGSFWLAVLTGILTYVGGFTAEWIRRIYV
jgi:hypothetical protein